MKSVVRKVLPLVVLAAGLTAPTTPANAQALLIILFGDKLSTETFQVGINADLTWTNATNVDNSSMRFSWLFGAYAQIKMSESLSIVPELTIKTPAGMTGFAIGDAGNPFVESDLDDINEKLKDGTVTRSLNYLTVPVGLRYQISRVGISGGGYVGYLTGGSDVLNATVPQGDLDLTASVTDVLNKFDAGVQAALDFSLAPEKKMQSLRIQVKGTYGLLDTVKDNPGDPVTNFGIFAGLQIPVGG